ncbi:hypothetical protein DNTS_004019, partial [Danionella cerebrum]
PVCMNDLFESGFAVNGGLNGPGQSPAHLAACGTQAFCLLWLLQTGADPNQQDANGETPMHKAARAGSLECLSALMASDAQLEICNSAGQTAEDLAWSCGFEECGRFLTMHRSTKELKSVSSSPSLSEHNVTLAGQKRCCTSSNTRPGKRACDW